MLVRKVQLTFPQTWRPFSPCLPSELLKKRRITAFSFTYFHLPFLLSSNLSDAGHKTASDFLFEVTRCLICVPLFPPELLQRMSKHNIFTCVCFFSPLIILLMIPFPIIGSHNRTLRLSVMFPFEAVAKNG